MKNLLIPFGIHATSKKEIEPEDALSGRSCDCICPGCMAPLLSRHPKKNRAHFAHDHNHPHALPEGSCPLSPFSSLMMMVRHVIPKLPGKLLFTPRHSAQLKYSCCSASTEYHQVIKEDNMLVVSTSEAGIADDIHYDFLITTESGHILVELTHPQKPSNLPRQIQASLDGLLGVMTINVRDFTAFALLINKQQALETLRYSTLVEHYLLQGADRQWIFHINEEPVIRAARQKHYCIKPIYSRPVPAHRNYPPTTYTSYTADNSQTPKSPHQSAADAYRAASSGELPKRPLAHASLAFSRYECLICYQNCTFPATERPVCAVCGTHLTLRKLP